MNLIRRTAVFATIVSALACHDTSAPSTSPVSFVLDNINGRPLPTFLTPVPEAPTIISASLLLGADGTAKLTEHRQQMAGGDVTYTNTYIYVITGNQIQFGYSPPCGGPAIDCVAPPKGTITGSSISLQIDGGGSGIVYNFRLIALD